MNKTTNNFFALALMVVAMVFASCSKDDNEKFTVKELEEYNFKQVSINKINDYLYEVCNWFAVYDCRMDFTYF